MVEAPIKHITVDERGIPFVGDTGMRVSYVAIDATRWGHTPDEIHRNYPHISMAQIHAALSYYYDHCEEVEEEIAATEREVEELRANSPDRFKQEELANRWRALAATRP